MQGNINLDVSFCISDDGFSLDELVQSLKNIYEEKAFGELIRMILMLVQEVLVARALSGDSPPCHCCEQPHFRLYGGYTRSVKTSLGMVQLRWRRVMCRNCKRNIVLLKEFMGLERYQRKSSELERCVIDAVSKDSYRRAVETRDATGFVSVPHRTAHNWVMESDCDELSLSNDLSSSLKTPVNVVADSTGFKGTPGGGSSAKGDLKVVVGINRAGEVFPVGSWAGTDWQSIKDELNEKQVDFGEGSVLVSDGEPGLAEAFADAVEFHQRCHWHVIRDLYHHMWQDGGNKKSSDPLQKGLAGVLGIDLPRDDFQQVSEDEKDHIEESMQRAENAVLELISYLETKGYTTAANYIESSRRNMFSYIRRWLKYGIICPRASSLIERVIRELGRRLKKIAYNWSNKGAGKIARIILKKFTNPEDWNKYWQEKMNINNKVFLWIGNYTITSQNLAH